MSSHNVNKLIKDCIYGHIVVPMLCLHFMNVPEFQRLRRVKQLGLVTYSYPSATHTRFEHSIGVMHLAGKMIDHLRNFCVIDDRTKELVQLSALYHDIGHFAFSHLFDEFLKKSDKEMLHHVFTMEDHEDRSVYFLRKVNDRLGLLSEEEVLFVKGCIEGEVVPPYPGFLFDIVSNGVSGIDVDRLDYVNRDANRCGFPSFQSDYIIYNTVPTSDLAHLGFQQKARSDIKDFFDTRLRMYDNVYFHHTSKKVEKMYYCMMKRLGDGLFVYGEETEDFNVETMMRASPLTIEIISELDSRVLTHDCELCHDFNPGKEYNLVKWMKRVVFV